MSRILDQFDRVRIVNLPYRTDRRREMDMELARIGLNHDPRVEYFAAFRPESPGPFTSIGAHGVYLSQKAILREAAAAGESVLILEDDCAFSPAAADYAAAEDWDIFYGGYEAARPDDLAGSDIIGAHMMGFSRRGARLVSAYLENLRPTVAIHPPIDAAYIWFRRAHPEVATHFAVPVLAVQRSSKSDIAAPKWHHRLPLGRAMGRLARKALNRWNSPF